MFVQQSTLVPPSKQFACLILASGSKKRAFNAWAPMDLTPRLFIYIEAWPSVEGDGMLSGGSKPIGVQGESIRET